MAVVKKEVYTTAQPDGTLVRTTTKTKTLQAADDEVEFTFGVGTINKRYCQTPSAILRILEIVCGLFIVCLVSAFAGTGPFIGILSGQTYVLVLACVCLCLTFALLVMLFLNLHLTHLEFVPWKEVDLVYSVAAAVALLVAACLEAWYASGTWRDNCGNYSGNGAVTRCQAVVPWAFAAGFCFLDVIFYAISAYLASKSKYFS